MSQLHNTSSSSPRPIHLSLLSSINMSIILPIFILLSNALFLSVVTIDPEPLTVAIKRALMLEKVDKKECTKIILYNTPSNKYVFHNGTGDLIKGIFSDDEFIPINISFIDNNTTAKSSHNFMTADLLEKIQVTTNHTINKAIVKRVLHCFLVISMVNTTQEANQMKTMSQNEMQERKLAYSMELTKLLQFKSPVNQRTLLLVRFGESQMEFGQCRRNTYQKYPRRLVPLWEQVLFDFFPNAVAVHAVKKEKVVTTRKEEGNLLWMCDDIIEKIEAEERCKNNMTMECTSKMNRGEFSTVRFNMTHCKGFTPRM